MSAFDREHMTSYSTFIERWTWVGCIRGLGWFECCGVCRWLGWSNDCMLFIFSKREMEVTSLTRIQRYVSESINWFIISEWTGQYRGIQYNAVGSWV